MENLSFWLKFPCHNNFKTPLTFDSSSKMRILASVGTLMAIFGSFWPFFGIWKCQNGKTEIAAEILLPWQFQNTPCFWFLDKNKDFGLFWHFLALFWVLEAIKWGFQARVSQFLVSILKICNDRRSETLRLPFLQVYPR